MSQPPPQAPAGKSTTDPSLEFNPLSKARQDELEDVLRPQQAGMEKVRYLVSRLSQPF